MKIMHLMLANFYIDGYNYQENVLPRVNKEDGHDVKIVASTETFINNTELGYITPGKYFTYDGIEVVRLPYKRSLFPFWERKRRAYIGLQEELKKFKPDVIVCHSTQFKDLDIVSDYKKTYPEVKVFADSHADYFNTATSFLSKNILHKMYYVPIIKRNLNTLEKVLCVSKSCKEFMRDFYKVPEDKLEDFLLGGIVEEAENYQKIRKQYRDKLCVADGDIVIMHSGKLDKLKKTRELISAFGKIQSEKLNLIIIGSVPEENAELIDLIKSDSRIQYLGWKNSEELMGYLAAADIYAQPGTQSATMQNAACLNNAMMLYPYDAHKYIFGKNALYVEDQKDIENYLQGIINNKYDIEEIQEKCYSIAKEKLDYRKMVEIIYR